MVGSGCPWPHCAKTGVGLRVLGLVTCRRGQEVKTVPPEAHLELVRPSGSLAMGHFVAPIYNPALVEVAVKHELSIDRPKT